jgi:hypothetical protein
MERALRLISSWFLLCVVVACASPPKEINPDRQTSAKQLLSGQMTKRDLSGFIGIPPIRCVTSSDTSEVCQWEAGSQQSGWGALAGAIGTRDWLNVVCDVRTDAGPRNPSSCGVYPRRSNRGSWSVVHPGDTRRQKRSHRINEKRRLVKRADQIISEAETIVDLSLLMGSVPDSCSPGSPDEQACVWRLTNRSFGHGTVATWIDAPKRKKIRLFCTLPTDGSRRQPGSCSASVGE